MKLKHIKKYAKVTPYRKAHFTERMLKGQDSKVHKEESRQFISLYGKEFEINPIEYRIVDRHFRYNGHYGFKLYNKIKCYYELFSPYYGTFEAINEE